LKGGAKHVTGQGMGNGNPFFHLVMAETEQEHWAEKSK
jgi:hypothetical protein